MRATAMALLFVLFGTSTHAGAWAQQEGRGFLSTSVRLAWPQNRQHWTSSQPSDRYYTAYLEYGLSKRMTIGLDFGRSVSGNGKTIAFLQMPVRASDQGPKISAALGLGRIGTETVIRPALHVGWGLKRGWFTIDSMAEHQINTGLTDYKVDVTWGRNLKRDRKLILQIQSGDPAADPPFLRLAQSMVFPLGKRAKVEAGATWGLIGDSSMGLKLGVWTEF